jgi:SAM-dependent methyltransferase
VTEHKRPESSVRKGFAREDWNARYAGSELIWSAQPNRLLVSEVAGLEPGRALDLACGEGRNAVWLAEQGWRTTGLDLSDVAIEKAARLGTSRGVDVDWVVADVLEHVPERGVFDLVVVLYLQLPHDELAQALHAATGALAAGGTLFVLGHDTTNLTDGYGGPRDPSVLFTPEDVVSELDGLTIERAEKVRRAVPLDDGEATAVDAFVRARRHC